jgi:hypothetical protein
VSASSSATPPVANVVSRTLALTSTTGVPSETTVCGSTAVVDARPSPR